MFSINDNVFCPMYGAGKIISIEAIDMNNEIKEYYVISIIDSNMKLKIPVDSDDSLIRNISNKKDCNAVLNNIKNLDVDDTPNWSKRYRNNMDKLRTGKLEDTASVLKSLIIRNSEKTLSAGERKMLHQAKHILISELSIALGMDRALLENTIYESLE